MPFESKPLTAMMVALVALAAPPEPATGQTVPATPRYTFSWPLVQGDPLAPRGGTTRGPAVTLDPNESGAWRSLHEPGIAAFERDRRAILAMAGDYRVTFDFLEVVPFGADAARDRPYQSWGTERVYVDRDGGLFISLTHILEMRVVLDDGSLSEPMVTKHWRQDWQYEPRQIIEYQGWNRWQRRTLARKQSARQWSQTVYQVDESPRYAGLGRWEHSASFSTWISGETWRPLPRREWSVRKYYQVLLGTNRHTITPWGWVQEENNLKTGLTPDRQLDPSRPYLAREYGVARYQRIKDADFAAADEYFFHTRDFWNAVRATWAQVFSAHEEVTLRAAVDQAGLFRSLFEYADDLAEGKAPPGDGPRIIQEALREMGAPVQATASQKR